jgi:L-threonylcarbamoyladenylate synthase
MISTAQLAHVLERPVAAATAIVSAEGHADVGQRSPGMADRHYAPRADVWLFEAAHVDEISVALATRSASRAHDTGSVIALVRRVVPLHDAGLRVTMMPDDPASYARALYAALHEADALGASLIVIERPPDVDAWSGIRDRLSRAAR